MATVTVNRQDNVVVVDSVPRQVDCSRMPTEHQAVWWNGSSGFIQFAQAVDVTPYTFRRNDKLTDFSDYQWAIDAWTAKGVEIEAQRKERAAEIAKLNAERKKQGAR